MASPCLLCNKLLTFKVDWAFLVNFKPIVNQSICKNCLDSFSPIDRTNRCQNCLKILVDDQACYDCKYFKKKYPYLPNSHQAFFTYDDFAHEWMKLFKVKGDLRLGEGIAPLIKEKLKMYRKDYLLVPVPSSSQSIKKRGFNQLEVILTASNLPYKELLEHKGSKIKKQSEKNKAERLKTPQSFQLKQGVELEKTKKILVIDDVYTTGTTMYHVKDVLYKEGFTDVSTLTFFR